MTGTLRPAATEVRGHPVAGHGARLGYLASAAVHALVAWTALELAWEGYGVSTTTTGPLRQLAGTTAGGTILWLIAGGICALVVWQLSDVAVARGTRRRAKPLGRAVAYGLLAAVSANVADGPGDDPMREEDVTVALMQYPTGRALVVMAGLVVVGTGVHHVRKEWLGTFTHDLHAVPGPWVRHAGRLGYVAKGVALVVAGALLVAAAAGYRSDGPQGLDAALGVMLELPQGTFLVTLMALRLAGYAVYAVARARRDWC